MLLDWVESLLTPCPRPLRALGYLRELLAIRTCQGWWGPVWEDHFQRTQDTLRRAAALCNQKRKAVVLGSGWLHDVPLADLAGAFREVVLVDAIHPLRTRWRARRFPNVRLLAADVTGVAEAVYRVATATGGPLPVPHADLFCADPEVDLVASVNLLSQLPYLPEQFLARTGIHPPEEIAAFARGLIEAHLDYLRRLPGVVAVVADVECLTVSQAGRVVRRHGTLHGVPFPWQGDSWVWPLVPRQRAYPHHGLHRLVLAVPDVKRAPPAT